MTNGPIDWGQLFTPNSKAKPKSRLHSCYTKGCGKLTAGKYCGSCKSKLREQTSAPIGSPSIRELRERNQARLRERYNNTDD